MKRLLAATLLTLSAPVWADATALFAAGKYAEAITAGTAENTPAGHVAAGRARLQIASYDVTDKAKAKAMIAASLADFDAALAKAPNAAAVQLQKAIAQGYAAKLDRSPGGAKAMRKAVEAVLARNPNDALGWAALGGWHGGAIATLGKFIAGSVLGAKTDDMDKGFARAMQLDPRDPAHPTYYALTLLDISTDNAPRARTLLRSAAGFTPGDNFEARLKASGGKVLALLDVGDAKAAQALARRLMPFGTVE